MSALQDMANGLVAERSVRPEEHVPEIATVGVTPHTSERSDHDRAGGVAAWLNRQSVGEKLRAISFINAGIVLATLLVVLVCAYFAISARIERMALSSAAIAAERLVADTNEGRLFVQRYAISGDRIDLPSALRSLDRADRDVELFEDRAISHAPTVLPKLREQGAMLERLRVRITEAQSLRFLRVMTVVWGIIGTGVALAIIGVESILDVWWKISGVFAGGMLGLFLLGFISRRANNPGAVTGATVGLLVILWLTFSTGLTGDLAWLRSPFHAHMTSVIGTLSIFLIGLGASQVFGRKSD